MLEHLLGALFIFAFYHTYRQCQDVREYFLITQSMPSRTRLAMLTSRAAAIFFNRFSCSCRIYKAVLTFRGMPDSVHALLSCGQKMISLVSQLKPIFVPNKRSRLAMSVGHNGRGEPTRNTDLAKPIPLRGIALNRQSVHRSYTGSPIRYPSCFVNGAESARCFSSRPAASCRSRSATILYLSKTERVL